MEEVFKAFARHVALGIETCAALFISIGAIETLLMIARSLFTRQTSLKWKKDVWLRFASWLILALEFELAADILQTAITPTWTDIGQLAAIAAVRTFLNYFLEGDIDKFEREGGTDAAET